MESSGTETQVQPHGATGGDGEQTAAASAPPAPSQPPTQTKQPDANQSGGVLAVHAEPGNNPGAVVGDAAPALADLQNQLCPNCSVGVLYVTHYDPNALHEAGQDRGDRLNPPALSAGYESGGAYAVKCLACDWSQSYALNPGRYHGQARD